MSENNLKVVPQFKIPVIAGIHIPPDINSGVALHWQTPRTSGKSTAMFNLFREALKDRSDLFQKYLDEVEASISYNTEHEPTTEELLSIFGKHLKCDDRGVVNFDSITPFNGKELVVAKPAPVHTTDYKLSKGAKRIPKQARVKSKPSNALLKLLGRSGY